MTRFPAEWEPQSAVLIAWPQSSGDFSQRLTAVEQTYIAIAEAIAARQKLFIVCGDVANREHIGRMLPHNPNILFLIARTNDIWVRDTAFLSVESDQGSVLLNFRFNGWGDKYPHDKDDALNLAILAQLPLASSIKHRNLEFILEGGSIESDGAGTLMTTRQCLLNPNRNHGLSQDEIEQRLSGYFGVKRVLWLNQDNLAGDDTDAHIDTLARFCNTTTIAYTSCDDKEDPHYNGLKEMEAQLRRFTDNNGNPYKLVSLPLPSPVYDEEGYRLPANYANFLIINGAILVPIYNDPMDNIALDRLAGCFADREVVPIPCRPLVHQYGSLHCMTMQFPAPIFL